MQRGLMSMLDPNMIAYLRNEPAPSAVMALGGSPARTVAPMPPRRPADMRGGLPPRVSPHSLDRINAVHQRQTQMMGGEVVPPGMAYNAMSGEEPPMPPPRPQGLTAMLGGAVASPAAQPSGLLDMLSGTASAPGGGMSATSWGDSGIGRFVGDNRNALMMLGYGIASGSMPNAIAGLAQGGALDEQARGRRETRAQAEARTRQLAGMLQARGLDPNLAQFPEVAFQYLGPQGGDPTDDMIEYDLARRQGFEGNFMDFLQASRSQRSRESEQQIAALVARGMSREEAENIAYGFVRPVTDPVLGGTRMANVIEGTLTPLQEAGRTQAAGGPSPVPPDQTLYGNVDDATGVANTARAAAADTLGQVPGVGRIFDFPETVQARQLFSNATNDLIRALSINPRFPVGEIERIRREINLDPSAFRAPEAMRSRMVTLDQYLAQRYENEVRAFQDPSLPAEMRTAAGQAAQHIRNFRAVLGVPQGATAPVPQAPGASSQPSAAARGGPAAVSVSTPEEAQALPPGTLYRTPDGQTYRR